jgi:ribosomal protein S18 acetylase RimI-like enzyme
VTVYPRLRMRLPLAEQALSASWRSRCIRTDDGKALGVLMLVAYRGTVDDEGETEADAVAEVERTMEGEYGPLLPDCSFVVEDDGGRIVGASMVTLFESDPFVTYVVVDPRMMGRGMGTFLIASSGNALLSAGFPELDLFVTEANAPAVKLYRRLGFQVMDRLTEPPWAP